MRSVVPCQVPETVDLSQERDHTWLSSCTWTYDLVEFIVIYQLS